MSFTFDLPVLKSDCSSISKFLCFSCIKCVNVIPYILINLSVTNIPFGYYISFYLFVLCEEIIYAIFLPCVILYILLLSEIVKKINSIILGLRF
jgi:hypothetical protein